MSSTFEKLPYAIKPINYNIEFIPNAKSFQFTGSQTIECEVLERVDTVKLNVKEVEVSDVTCNSLAAQVSYDEPNEIVILKFPSALESGKAMLSMKFKGTHNDQMKGFYRSTYTTATGEQKINLCTQFEATSARMAFPCMDEPDRKASFTISMVVPSNKVALSNMPEIERKPVDKPAGLPDIPDGHYVRVAFDRSPIMSTYLLAMVVGDFEYIEDKDANGVVVRVFAPPGKKHCCDFAMDVAKKSLPFYSECFGVAYPLPKLDLIAIPDFAAGAMENWGLVTYRETALLIDPEQASGALKERVALVVAHELAHMWFGNLVTMKWWTHLWLNEGFATWMEYLCVDKVLPEFDIWTTFTTSELSTAFSLDALKNSHPIEVEVNSPSEVDEIFDSISYAKGASIINMLYNWIGHDSFFLGLKDYIARYQYQNTQTEDLWDAFAKASGQDVRGVMSEWTKKMGYPVVTVSSDTANSCLVLDQKRFLADGSVDTDDYKWPIPLSIAHPEKSKISHLVNPADAATSRVQVPADVIHDLLINPGRASFVRLLYSDEMMAGVKRMLAGKVLGPRDRLAVLDDHISLAFAGHIPISNVVDLMMAYAGEGHHDVWDSLSFGISHIRLLVEEAGADHNHDAQAVAAALEGINRLCVKIAGPVFEKLGWDPVASDGHNESLLRSTILSMLGRTGYQPVVEEARKRFDAHAASVLAGSGPLIKADVRMAVYSICMRHGGPEVFDQLVKLYEAATMSDERVRLLNCLGVSGDAAVRQKALQYALSEAVRKQDRYCTIISLNAAGPAGRRDNWEFVKKSIGILPDALGSQNLLTHVLKNSCKHFAHPDRLSEVSSFWDANPVPCQRAVKQAVEQIGINLAQLSRDGPSLIAKLATI